MQKSESCLALGVIYWRERHDCRLDKSLTWYLVRTFHCLPPNGVRPTDTGHHSDFRGSTNHEKLFFFCVSQETPIASIHKRSLANRLSFAIYDSQKMKKKPKNEVEPPTQLVALFWIERKILSYSRTSALSLPSHKKQLRKKKKSAEAAVCSSSELGLLPGNAWTSTFTMTVDYGTKTGEQTMRKGSQSGHDRPPLYDSPTTESLSRSACPAVDPLPYQNTQNRGNHTTSIKERPFHIYAFLSSGNI